MAKKRRSSQFKDSSQVIDIEEARRKRQEKRRRQRSKQSGQSGAANKAAEAAREKPVRASVKQNKRRRMLIYTAIIAAIIAVVGMSVYNIISLKQEQKDTKIQNQKLKEQKASLEKQLEKLNDPEYIEDQARTQLRLVMPGEKIYVFPLADEDEETQKENKQKDEN